ncbi:30S ribosomal protein S8 [Candidatus Woesearchaeota archaeon]|nr:30S ribosomal protein S8 [uncultured archaeon]MBS3102557.1 30S ribosomal protein S8 [Candidatus Woesearchaeota archaeon]
MLNDPLSNALSKILNDERIGRNLSTVKPVSKLIKKVLDVMKDNGYVGEFKKIEDGRGNMLQVNLLGSINKCGVIKPRFSVKKGNYEKFEKRYLPAKDVGIVIVSTPYGILTHYDAKKKNTGGRLLAYCY